MCLVNMPRSRYKKVIDTCDKIKGKYWEKKNTHLMCQIMNGVRLFIDLYIFGNMSNQYDKIIFNIHVKDLYFNQ